MTADREFDFAPDEVQALGRLQGTLNKVADWPPDSPLSFVMTLASRTRGKLGEMLLKEIANGAGIETGKAESVAYDVKVGLTRCEVKFSTEDPPRFQQVRDPRSTDGDRYDYLVGISGRPENIVYWLIPASDLGTLMDDGHVTVQHAMSDTKWFLPSRTGTDVFSGFRHDYKSFVVALKARA